MAPRLKWEPDSKVQEMSDRPQRHARDAAAKFLARPVDKRLGDSRRNFASMVEARERPLFHELVAGTTRREICLDAVLSAYSNAPIGRIERRLKTVLRLALYQLIFLDGIPDHAAVSESLKLIPSKRARGFANGILRQVLREGRKTDVAPAAEARRCALPIGESAWFVTQRPILPDPEEEPLAHVAAAHGFPVEAAALLVAGIGDEAALAVMSHANMRPQTALRVCGDLSQRQSCVDSLRQQGVTLESLGGPESGVFGLETGIDPATLTPFQSGELTVQGPFAARVAPLLGPQAGERVLDLCAAPGGKAIHLAELAPDAEIVAYAQDVQGGQRLNSTLARCQRANIKVVQSRKTPYHQGPFDRILLDVPCSNSGVLSRRPEARHRLDRRSLASLAQIQRSLLKKTLSKCSPKTDLTRVVYSTCSILPGENGDLVRLVLKDFANAKLVQEIQALPQGPWLDGGYAALIELGPPVSPT